MSIFAKCNTVRYMRKKEQEVLLRPIITTFFRINSHHFSSFTQTVAPRWAQPRLDIKKEQTVKCPI